jgi:amidase
MRASAGAAALADFVPRREATLVRRLRAAGAVVLGKTNMTELADYVSDVMPSEFSGAGGVVRNPHGIAYGRGQGSSVGSAAAIAAGFAPVAIGSETQNSIQTPACFTSVVGIKPSVGVVSRHGLVPLVPSQDSPGPIGRSVADAAAVLAAIAGADVRDGFSLAAAVAGGELERLDGIDGLRIGVPRRCIADRPDVAAVAPEFEAVLSRLSRSGARVVDPCDLPAAEQLQDVRSSVFRTEFKAALDAFLEDNGSPCGIASLDALIAWNERHPEAIPYGQSLLLAAAQTAGLDDPVYRADRRRDIVLSRTAGIEAALAAGGADVLIAPMGAAAKCTGKAGAPVVALPAGLDASGTPFGVVLFAAPGDDRRLLRIAAAVECAVGERRLPRL